MMIGSTVNEITDCFTYRVAGEVDARQLRCPLPLLKAKQALRNLEDGAVLRVLATDSGSVRDFQSYCDLGNHDLLGFSESEGVYCYLLKKKQAIE